MVVAQAVSRRCIFCDNAVNSGEHIWPRWMRDLLKRPGHIKRTEIAHDYSRRGAPFGTVSRWTSNGATHQKKVHVVCAACNNGWMNRQYETPNRRFLEPMLLGKSLSLDTDAQHSIAQWVALKVLVVEQDPDGGQRPTPIFDRRSRIAFKKTGKIPNGFRIWLAARGGEEWHDSLTRSSGRIVLLPKLTAPADFVPAGQRRNTQAVTWGAGHLLVHALAVTYPYLDRRLLWEGPSGGPQIWPLRGSTIQWPPGAFLLDWAAEAVSAQLATLNHSLPRTPPSTK
jgi:hypothetical protein